MASIAAMRFKIHSICGSIISCGLLVALSSCGVLKSPQEVEAQPAIEDASAVGATNGAFNGLKGIQPKVSSPSQLYDEKDIVWANEDPDAPMTELEALWEKGPQDDWFKSYSQAMKEARKEGKPVLMWFNDSKSKMTNQALSSELFSTTKFTAWAQDHVVRLQIDSFVQDDDDVRLAHKRKYVNDLKKRHKVMGSPVVLMLSPRGAVFGKYAGYKRGSSSFYLGRLKNAHRNAMADYGAWREDLEARGYRVWHDHRGRKVFAKPRRLDGDVLHLVSPSGSRSKASLNKLSAEDRSWVKEQQLKKSRSQR